METSKYGYKNFFKSWINEVIAYKSKKEVLEEKVKLLKGALFGCSGISYDNVKTSRTFSSNDRVIDMLSRIEEVEMKIQELNLKLEPYNSLVLVLSPREKEVLELCFINKLGPSSTARALGVSRNNIYLIINNIMLKFN